MGAMPAAQRMTAGEFLDLPDTDDLRWAQLIEGELIVDAPRPLHQKVAGELIYLLMSWARSGEGRGTVWHQLGIKLDERNVFQPDVLWYCEDAGPDLHSRPPSPVPQLAESFDVALELTDLLTSPQLDGFELPLVELFPE
jgi:Uma2 family endonuclease